MLVMKRIFLLIACVLLTLNFQFDIIDQLLFKSNYVIFQSYQSDSAQIVINCISNILSTKDFTSPLINQGGTYYFQQIGLQGKIMGILAYLFSISVPNVITMFQLLNSILLALLFGYFVNWSIKEFGGLSGVILFFTMLCSTWVIFMARNIYWVEWLMFLPVVLNLWYFSNVKDISKYYILLYFAIYFVRFCCGFEFTSSFIIAGYLPYLYYHIKNVQVPFLSRKFLLNSCLLFIVPTIAFVMVFITILLQAHHYLGSWSIVSHELFFNINKRIGLEKDLPGYGVFEASMNAGYVNTILIYFKLKPIFGETVVGLKQSNLDYINFMSAVYFLSILNIKHILRNEAKKSLLIISIISVLAPVSWYVLAKPHSFWHSHINAILLFIPTIFFQTILIAFCIKDIINYGMRYLLKLLLRKHCE